MATESDIRVVIRRIQAAVRACKTPEGSEGWREEVKAAIKAVEVEWFRERPIRIDSDEKPYVAPAGFLGDIREKHHGDDDGYEN